MRKLLYQEQKEMARRMLPYAITMFIHYIGINVCNYDTLFMQMHGFSTATIGTMGGVACVLTIFAEMFFSRLSDASRSVKKIAIIGAAITALSTMLCPSSVKWYVGTIFLGIGVMVFRNIIITPSNTLLENWILRSSYQERYDYGIMKAIAAIGAVLGSVLASGIMILLCRKLDQVQAVDAVFYIGGGLVLLAGITMFPMRDAPSAAKENVTRESLNPLRILRNKEYLALMLVYCFTCVAINPVEAFLSVVMTENKLDPAKLGFIMGLQAVFQFPVLLLFSKLSGRLKMRPLIALGTILYGVTAILRGNATAMWILVVSTVFQGAGASILVTSAYNYIYELVPIELRGTGQSYFIIFGSLGGAVGATLGGHAIAAWGVQSFYIRAGIVVIAVGAGYYLLTQLQKMKLGREENDA